MVQINCELPATRRTAAARVTLKEFATLIDRPAQIERRDVKGNYSFGD